MTMYVMVGMVGACAVFVAYLIGSIVVSEVRHARWLRRTACDDCGHRADAWERGVYTRYPPHSRVLCVACTHVANAREEEQRREARIRAEVERLQELDEAKRRFEAERERGYR